MTVLDRMSEHHSSGVKVSLETSSAYGWCLSASWSDSRFPTGSGKRLWGADPLALLEQLDAHVAAHRPQALLSPPPHAPQETED